MVTLEVWSACVKGESCQRSVSDNFQQFPTNVCQNPTNSQSSLCGKGSMSDNVRQIPDKNLIISAWALLLWPQNALPNLSVEEETLLIYCIKTAETGQQHGRKSARPLGPKMQMFAEKTTDSGRFTPSRGNSNICGGGQENRRQVQLFAGTEHL